MCIWLHYVASHCPLTDIAGFHVPLAAPSLLLSLGACLAKKEGSEGKPGVAASRMVAVFAATHVHVFENGCVTC